jgi:hypothetical protein
MNRGRRIGVKRMGARTMEEKIMKYGKNEVKKSTKRQKKKVKDKDNNNNRNRKIKINETGRRNTIMLQ